ncbi:MAG: hypothetical protein ABFD76_15340 [Smithella sp.]
MKKYLPLLLIIFFAVSVYAASTNCGGGGIDPASPGPIGSTTPSTGSFTALNVSGAANIGSNVTMSGGNITGANITVYDTVTVTADAWMDSVINSPDAAIKVQGSVANIPTANVVAANVNYGTFTAGTGGNVTTAVYSSGTQTATVTITSLTANKLYQWTFTPAINGQVPTITATSGIAVAKIPTAANATAETISFRANDTTAVFTFTNTGASTWSIASSVVSEYTRPAIAREFINGGNVLTQQTVLLDWAEKSWTGGNITITPYMVCTNATAPAANETIVWSFSGYCVGDSDSLSQASGVAVNSTYTAPATIVRYDEMVGTETAQITLAGAGAGKACRIMMDRVQGTYAQKVGQTKYIIKYPTTKTGS